MTARRIARAARALLFLAASPVLAVAFALFLVWLLAENLADLGWRMTR